MYVVTSRLQSRKWKWKQLGLGSSRRAVQVYGDCDCDWQLCRQSKHTTRGVEREEGGECATGTWDTKRFKEITTGWLPGCIHVHILKHRQTGDKWLKLLCFRSLTTPPSSWPPAANWTLNICKSNSNTLPRLVVKKKTPYKASQHQQMSMSGP